MTWPERCRNIGQIYNRLDKNAHVEVVCQLSNHRKRPDSYVKLEVEAEDYYRIKDSEKSE